MKRIVIDKNKCIGCFQWKHCCYSVFEIGSDGKAKVRYGISQGGIIDTETAVINCPTGAISIVELDSSNSGSTGSSFISFLN